MDLDSTIARQLVGKQSTSYWQQSRRPLASLAFVMPLLVMYESGVLLLGPGAIRNGADVWLRQLLDWIGFGQYFLLPVLTIGVLLAWHHTTGERWRLSAGVLYGMFAESALLGMALIGIGHLQGSLLSSIAIDHALEVAPILSFGGFNLLEKLERLINYFGAGIYEEVLFRLLLLPAVMGLIKLLGGSAQSQIVGSVLLTSFLFSAAHYIGPLGDAFGLQSFLFRFVAGIFFAVLFVYRGFGIAAGTHALYDIFVGLRQ